MLTFSSTQAEAWIAFLLWPFLRVLALMTSVPVLGDRVVPARARIGLSVLIAVLVAPLLPPVPAVPLFSGESALRVVQQVAVGIMLGLSVRIVLSAAEMAGDLIGLQMGLGAAALFDPQGGGQTPILGGLLAMMVTLVFIALDGPLIMVATVADSFRVVPVGSGFGDAVRWEQLAARGAELFAYALQLALPMLTTLLSCNVALGIMARVAPQLNLFSVGFPLTLLTGFAVLVAMMAYMVAPLQNLVLAALRPAL